VCFGAPSTSKVLRQLKRQEQGLFNCVASVIADAAFVQEVRPWRLCQTLVNHVQTCKGDTTEFPTPFKLC